MEYIDKLKKVGLSNSEIEEIVDEIIKKNKKYGLVFEDQEDQEEQVDVDKISLVKKDEINADTKNSIRNMLIEGDNLYALSYMQNKYIDENGKGMVDVIYIDPPYNTGNTKFVYKDNMRNKKDIYKHSQWLNFMSERLKLARNIMSDDGVIFISIDDNEQAQLKLLCDEIFGEKNFITNFVWLASSKKYNEEDFNNDVIKASGNNSKDFKSVFEYILAYRKTPAFKFNMLKSEEKFIINRITDNRGRNKVGELILPKGLRYDGNEKQKVFKGIVGGASEPIHIMNEEGMICENGVLINDVVIKTELRNPNLLKRFFNGDKIIDEKGQEVVEVYITKSGVPKIKKTKAGEITINVLSALGSTASSRNLLIDILGYNAFSYPKPVALIKYLVNLHSKKDAIVLDFFAGSGTTGQAIIELNEEDGGNRKFILCTNNENNICEEVTYNRLKTVITGIRTDGSKYSEGLPANLDYYKIDYKEIV